MELSEQDRAAARKIGDAAGRSAAQAVQVAEARTREEALAMLLAVIGQAGALRDDAAGLYVQIIESGGEG